MRRILALAVALQTAVVCRAATFTVDFEIDLSNAEPEQLWKAGEAVTLCVREAGMDKALAKYDAGPGNYLPFRVADGRCLVLEASMACPAGRVGIPLGAMAVPGGVHRVTLDYNGVYWSILVDDVNLDRDLPWRDLPEVDLSDATVLSSRVLSAQVHSPGRADAVAEMSGPRSIDEPIQYWTPRGHNAWVGDVAVCAFGGRFHVFYLHDRRNHGSMERKGGHSFAHISSPDLVHWTEHRAAVPIVHSPETLGTGTPFVYDGNLCLAFGFHTMRFMPADKTTEPLQKRYYEKHGREGVFEIARTPGFPVGGSFAVSRDGGETFSRSGILFTRAQNPTVYNRTDGRLGLVTSYGGIKGLFASDHPGDWELVDDNLPFRGDCPCYFEWHGHAYLLQGFCRMAYNHDGQPGHFVDWTVSGDDIYDGLSVPMVASWKDDRRILAGWLHHVHGWGGWLCFRELVQEEDGRLGTKWVPEIQPRGDILEHRAKGGQDVRLRFKRVDQPGPDLEFSVDALRCRAQFSDAAANEPAPWRKTIAEAFRDLPPEDWLPRKMGHEEPSQARSFAIGHLRGLDSDYVVKLARYYDKKSDATIFDAEIAGRRTIICRRPGRYEPCEPPITAARQSAGLAGVRLSDGDKIRYGAIFAPQHVGRQEVDAFREMGIMEDGRIRHYGVESIGGVKRRVYIESDNLGLDWRKHLVTDTADPGAMTQSPWSGDWICMRPNGGGKPISVARSKTGPGDARCAVKLLEDTAGVVMFRQPMPLSKRGHWLVAAEQTGDGVKRPCVLLSNDDGANWRKVVVSNVVSTAGVLVAHDKMPRWNNYCNEPTVVEKRDGSLWMIVRTSFNNHHQYFSYDGGVTWEGPTPVPYFYASNTTPTFLRLKDGRLLFFWNNTQPLSKGAVEDYPELNERERRGGAESVFTNRDALHVAISEDDGETWIGFRELYLNPVRNEADFREHGKTPLGENDKSVHQNQAIELPGGKVLVACGQHPVARRLIMFDVRWLYETHREEDFSRGLVDVSTHLYVKSLTGNNRGWSGHCAWNRIPGVVMAREPGSTPETRREVAKLCRTGDGRLVSDRQGLVWNFPSAKRGRVEIACKVAASGFRLALSDHWFNPCDEFAGADSPVFFDIDWRVAGREWSNLSVEWDVDAETAVLVVNGQKRMAKKLMFAPRFGVSYLHLQTLAEGVDFEGVYLRSLGMKTK